MDEYLRTAKDDLESSEILFEREKYAQSLFYMEKSVETLCKYLIIKLNIADSEELKKKVRHKSYKVFYMLVNYFNERLDGDEFSQYKEDLNLEKERIIETRAKYKTQLTDVELDDIFFTIGRVRKIGIVSPYDHYFEQELGGVIDTLRRMKILDEDDYVRIQNLIESSESGDVIIRDLRNRLNDIPKIQELVLILNYLAIVFVEHDEETRYPDQRTKKTPNEAFSIDVPIVSNIPRFNEIVAYLIKEFDDLIIWN